MDIAWVSEFADQDALMQLDGSMPGFDDIVGIFHERVGKFRNMAEPFEIIPQFDKHSESGKT